MLALCMSMVGEEDRELFLRFHSRYEGRLYAVAWKILGSHALAEEAVQEVMLRIAAHFSDLKNLSKILSGNWPLGRYYSETHRTGSAAGRGAERPPGRGLGRPRPGEHRGGVCAYRRLVAPIRAMPETYRTAPELRFVLEW